MKFFHSASDNLSLRQPHLASPIQFGVKSRQPIFEIISGTQDMQVVAMTREKICWQSEYCVEHFFARSSNFRSQTATANAMFTSLKKVRVYKSKYVTRKLSFSILLKRYQCMLRISNFCLIFFEIYHDFS